MCNDNIPIFFSTDNNYAVPTYIALFSLLKNFSGRKKIKAYVLLSKDFRDEYKGILNNLSEEFNYLEIEFIYMGDQYSSVAINNEHITTATMYRLLIPHIGQRLEIGKCIYLDSDIVVEGDISELFDIDINGFCIGGVSDIPKSQMGYRNNNRSHLKQYVNAGVLLINVHEIVKQGLDKKLESLGYCGFPDNDQDAINEAFCNSTMLLPNRFNTRKIHFQKANRRWDNPSEVPVIMHYVSYNKPWLYKNDWMACYWWKYVNLLDHSILEGFVNPFLRTNRLSFDKRTKEIIKMILIKLRLYYPMIAIRNYLQH